MMLKPYTVHPAAPSAPTPASIPKAQTAQSPDGAAACQSQRIFTPPVKKYPYGLLPPFDWYTSAELA